MRLVADLMKSGARTLIFCETKRGCDDLTASLRRESIPALAIHGDKAQEERDWVLAEFKSGRTPLMIATEMGVPEVLLKAILEAEHKANSIFGAVEKGLAALQKAKGKGGLFAPLASLWGR
jgi:superfamily II DNA/RNA helicase